MLGITGTSAEKRDDFQRLLADCRRGRVDKILVKSSSRFARNAKECLEAIRELKALGVGVCFEEQGIDIPDFVRVTRALSASGLADGDIELTEGPTIERVREAMGR